MSEEPDMMSTRMMLLAGALAVLSGVGCDAPSGNAGTMNQVVNADGTSSVSMAPPAEWLMTRMVNLDSLQLLVTLDDVPQASTRTATDRWEVNFVLPDDSSHSVRATWQEQLPDRTMTLAVSPQIPVSNTQPERNVRISEYLHRDFDEDNDAISNLDERRLGRDPLVADLVTPGTDQTDCRANTASIAFGNFFVDVDAPGFGAPLAVASNATVSNLASATTEGMLAVFESFFVLTPGRLTVSHFGGPGTTGAILYDTDGNGTFRRLARDNIPLAASGATFESRRAVVTADVRPGLYCYRLESTMVDDPIIDPALQYAFTAIP